jgi:hypothetical protein
MAFYLASRGKAFLSLLPYIAREPAQPHAYFQMGHVWFEALLEKEHGKPVRMKVLPTQINKLCNLLQSLWKFKRHSKRGISGSGLLAVGGQPPRC